MSHQRLSAARIVVYAFPALVSSVATLPLILFVPAFYADNLGVPLAAVGWAIAASRLLDVITDPLIGRISDKIHFRWGRRKPWILLGTPIFILALWKVFVPGTTATATYLFGWSALLYLGFTMLDLPHKAWGAELSTDYDERSRITSWREGLSTSGQVTLLAILFLLGARGVTAADEQLGGMALAIAIGGPVLIAASLLSIGERRPQEFSHEGRNIFEGLRLISRIPGFTRMLGCVVFFVGGIVIQGTLNRLVLADVMGDEQLFPLMLLVENAATLAAVPIWLRVSIRIGKHRALIAAALWIGLLSLPLMFLRSGDTTALIVWIAIRGSSFASILFLSNSIAADVIDLDILASGKQRSGLFFATWGMVTKFSLALGVVLGTSLPASLGYDPSAEWVTPAVQARLMAVYGGVPAVMMAIGALFLRGFPVTRERHAEVRAAIAARGIRP